MKLYSVTIRKILDKWPGKKYFKEYRFLPFFFVFGAAIEFSMINWTAGTTNFYKTYKRNQSKIIAEEKFQQKLLK